MTRPASLSQAEIARAIKAAEACGKVAVMTKVGIVFAERGQIALPSPDAGHGAGGRRRDGLADRRVDRAQDAGRGGTLHAGI